MVVEVSNSEKVRVAVPKSHGPSFGIDVEHFTGGDFQYSSLFRPPYPVRDAGHCFFR